MNLPAEIAPGELAILADDIQAEISALDKEVETALGLLNDRQMRFCLSFVHDGLSQEKALLAAGYAEVTARKNPMCIAANLGIQRALKCMQRRQALENGWSPTWKRRQWEGALQRAKQEENHARSATAQDKCLRSMAEYDGELKGSSEGTGGVQIHINTGIASPGVTVEGEVITVEES